MAKQERLESKRASHKSQKCDHESSKTMVPHKVTFKEDALIPSRTGGNKLLSSSCKEELDTASS